nr:3-keto-5-aminohexanoate cleavage protein [Rubrobacter sp.]
MEKVIISAAITGGMTVPGQSGAIPITPDEIVDSAVEAHEAGAAIVHLHVREPASGKPSSSLELFREVVT